MLIRLGYELIFDVPAPVPMLLLLSTHPSRAAATSRSRTTCASSRRFRARTSWTASATAARASSPRPGACVSGTIRGRGFRPTRSGPPRRRPASRGRAAGGDAALPAGQPLLRGGSSVRNGLEPVRQRAAGWGRVQAVCDWVHANVQFGYHSPGPTKTAYDVYTEAPGVCRDFTHLAITFCRCMNIPARYATGYLGDIGVPSPDAPMDFSAWFEVYLGGRWHTFDARHNIPRIGRVLMARGRDAVDVALTTSFGPTRWRSSLSGRMKSSDRATRSTSWSARSQSYSLASKLPSARRLALIALSIGKDCVTGRNLSNEARADGCVCHDI